MPPVPTLPGIYRVSVNWQTISGLTAVNVMHFQAAPGDPEGLGADLRLIWDQGMNAPISSNAVIQSFTVQELDGSDAVQIAAPPNPHNVGGGSADFAPQVCVLLRFLTGGGGRSGRGRLFLPFIGESQQNQGEIPAVDQVALRTAWSNFQDSMANTQNAFLGVASYTNASFRGVTQILVSPFVATQRRRNRRT